MQYIDECFNELVEAIIIQAAVDFGTYTKKLVRANTHCSKEIAERELNRIREFFTSSRFHLFSDMDGNKILARLEQNPFVACTHWKQRA